MHVDATGATREPAVHIVLSVVEIRPFLVAKAVAALRADIGPGPVMPGRRAHRRIGRIDRNSAKAIIGADLDDMQRLFDRHVGDDGVLLSVPVDLTFRLPA